MTEQHTYARDPQSREHGVPDWACVVCGKDEPNGHHRP